MSKVNLDKLTHRDLVELQQEIAGVIERRKREEVSELRRKMVELASESGLELDDVLGRGRGGKRGPAAVKFRNPKDPSQTWAGRGRKPIWLTEAIKKGAKMESFAE